MNDDPPLPDAKRAGVGTPWQILPMGTLGVNWAFNYLLPAMLSGPSSGAALGFLPVFGLAAPFLREAPPKLRTVAFWFCLLEAGLSGLLWFGAVTQFMDPIGLKFRLFGIPIWTMWGAGEQFLYFAARAGLFVFAAAFIRTMPKRPAADGQPAK